ncbi:hypothetical protein BJY24_004542 [Nocardia transvalensis]|uniref:Acyl-CoA thioesterase-like C-terminal domain-containing protein n=1 Tax=Nocardia transvalensis TaxID=37333 RepID=A0A7W9UKE6_9NOCA|nr:hypothetical protein [Nocardia transvalensis]MBB5915630.1 hypothetical protein [Nocardia transvalensis]
MAPEPPPADFPVSENEERLYLTEGVGWGRDVVDVQNGERNQIWHFAIPTVEGERPTPFQLAAGVADVMNLVSNFGDGGLEFINADATLHLARLPEGPEIGLSSTGRVEQDGISVGAAVVFDRTGVIGTASVSGLANAHRALDIGEYFRTRQNIGG